MTTLIPKYDQGSSNAVNRPINQKLLESVSVMDFGAVGNGTTDDTTAIQNAISSGATAIYFPTGNYLISSTINLGSTGGITLYGSGQNSKLVKNTQFHFFSLLGGVSSPTAFANNVEIFGLQFYSSVWDKLNFCLYARTATQISFHNNLVINCSGLQTDVNFNVSGPDKIGTTLAIAGFNSLTYLNSNIKFSNNTVYSVFGDTTQIDWVYAVQIKYATNIVISNNNCKNANIVWWGGNASTSDGAIGNTRYLNGMSITGNYVYGGQSCIWGSMADGFSITGNTVEQSSDSGIDPEGSFNGSITGNVSKNNANFNYSTFALTRNVVFEGNTSVINSQYNWSGYTKEHFSFRNTDTSAGTSLSFIGNTCETVGTLAYADYQIFQSVIFKNNTFINCTLIGNSLSPNSGGAVEFTDNFFVFDYVIANYQSQNAVWLGITDTPANGGSTIARNQIRSRVSQTSGAGRGLWVNCVTSTNLQVIQVEDNIIDNFYTGIVLAGTINNSMAIYMILRNNIISLCTTTINNSLPSGSVLTSSGNINQSGSSA